MDDVEADATPGDTRFTKRFQASDIDFGARVRALRVAQGMSQTTLGTVVGVSFQQMQKYEAGKDRISASTLFCLAAALGVPVSSFFGGPLQHASSGPVRSGAGDHLSTQIVVLFQQIDDPGIRKQLVALAAALASAEVPGLPKSADEAAQ